MSEYKIIIAGAVGGLIGLGVWIGFVIGAYRGMQKKDGVKHE